MRTSFKFLGSACAGALLMACSGMGVSTHPVAADREQAVTALERACLLDPLNAQSWEHLAAALQADGQTERAASMFRQATMLREHDIRHDLAMVAPEAPDAPDAQAAAKLASGDIMDRTEVVPAGAALVLVRRVLAKHTAQQEQYEHQERQASLRLEISNGNGVNGQAARWARKLEGTDIRIVRLSNIKPFAVSASRIEYSPHQQGAARTLAKRINVPLLAQCDNCSPADVRVVLGRDLRGTGAP